MRPGSYLPVLVVGGGVTGMAAALHLARDNQMVIILEKESALGGKVQHINCKQVNGKCTHCGACAVYELVHKVNQHPLIQCLTRQQVISVKNIAGIVEVTARGPEGSQTLSGMGAIIASGLKPFPAEVRPETGYGTLPRVITALDLEKRARQRGSFAFLGQHPRIAIIHCVGSRQDYCSRVCCLYGAKISRLLAEALPEASLDAYCLDRQRYRPEYMAEWPPAVRITAAMPGRIYQDSEGDYIIRAEDSLSGILVERKYDWVILCTGLIPDPDSVALGLGAGLVLDDYGFLKYRDQPGLIMAAGGASAPLTFFECIESGIGAAGQLLLALR